MVDKCFVLSKMYFPPHCQLCNINSAIYIHVFFPLAFPGVSCPLPGNVVAGRVTPMLTEYFYRDHIFARCNQGYKLMMVRLNFPCFVTVMSNKQKAYEPTFDQFFSLLFQDGQEIESFSTMCQSNGQWHLPLPECHSMSPLISNKTAIVNWNCIVI